MLKRPEEFAYFAPSAATIKRCLLTRKSDIKIGTAVKPGLIGCDDFGWDSLFFSICIALEIIGLGAILMNRLPVMYAITGMLFAIILDCLLALWLHALVSGKTVMLRAEQVEARAGLGNFQGRTHEERNAWALQSERQVRNRKRWAILPAIGIVVFCLAKIIAYAGLKGFRVDTGLFLVVISYIIVAYIHLTRTGFWIAAVVANYWWGRDIKRHEDEYRNGHGTQEFGPSTVQAFEVNSDGLRADAPPRVMRAGRVVHEVVTLVPFEKRPDGSTTPGKYELRCNGVLMDDEVRELLQPIALGANEIRQAIALRCMAYQLSLIQVNHEGGRT